LQTFQDHLDASSEYETNVSTFTPAVW
jgi:hypothetical protein